MNKEIAILSKRRVEEGLFFHIVFEWEDILSKQLDIPIKLEKQAAIFGGRIYRKLHLSKIRMDNCFHRKSNKIFKFDMSAGKCDSIYNTRKYITCIIDYFLREDEYWDFVRAYSRNSLVLISSREVYEYLKEKQCPLSIEHFPLSIPDDYWQDTCLKKEYDLVMCGRQNPILETYVERYEKEHIDFKVIRRKYENGQFIYYDSRSGQMLCDGDSHDEYIKIIRKSKCALYSTPGMDDADMRANNWNQVTPRFLEEIACQCHIIARYPDNADTRWYEMADLCTSVGSYEEFSNLMTRCRNSQVNLNQYKQYIQKHVTSQRAERLAEIFEKYNIF